MKDLLSLKTKRFFVSVLSAIGSLLLCFIYGSLKAGCVFALFFLISGVVRDNKKVIRSRWKTMYLVVLFVFSSFFIVFVCQRVLNESLISLGLQRLVLNACLSGAVILLFFLISLNNRASLIISSGMIASFSTFNYYVFLFRGSELNPADILAIGTAANVAADYKVELVGVIIYAWLLLLIYWFLLFSLPIVKVERKVPARSISIIFFAACIGIAVIGSNGIQVLHFMQTGSVKNGYILNFCMQLRETIVSPPDKYTADSIAQKENQFLERENSDESKPDIFIVMDESFADLSILGSDIRTNKEVMPFTSSLHEDTIKGYALSSVFGGGTPNSEYEFLSGNSMFFLPAGAIVYQQYLKTPAHSMIVDMKELNYKCVAMHPSLSNGWERERVYPLLGYDESLFLEDFPQKKLERAFVSDQEAFEEMIRRYRGYKKESDNNTFIFMVTMQNHGGYTYEGENYKKTISLLGYNAKYPDAEQYLTLIHKSDNAIKWLVSTLKDIDHDVVLVFYGDHLPKLDDRFYQEIHGGPFTTLDEQNLEQTVPFFVWTNYDIDEETVDLTSFNFLSNYMYTAARIELPAYNQFLERVSQSIPCMNAFGYYSKKDKCFKAYEEADGKEKELLNEYHQFVFNCMFDSKHRNEHFFPLLNYR